MKPKIRFKDFNGEWEKIPFSEITNRTSISASSNNFPGVEFEDINSGQGTLNKNVSEKKSVKVGKYFKEGDVLFGKLRPYLKNILLADFEGTAIGDFWVLRPQKITSELLYVLVNSREFMRIANISSGSKMPRADWNLVSSTGFVVPINKDEQQTLGAYFQRLDQLIQATGKKIEVLKQVKAASLQSMFPQEGETTPCIRFKGFTDEWKSYKMSDIANFSKGRGYSKSDLKDAGVPIILYGSLYTNYQTTIREVNTYVDVQASSRYSNEGEIIIPASGETAEDIACAAVVSQKGIILGGDLNILTLKDNMVSEIVALSLTYGKAHYDLVKRAQGKTVVHLHNSDIKETVISLPKNKDEQMAIASYFANLDTQISLQIQRLEKLKQIKSACLDNMFV